MGINQSTGKFQCSLTFHCYLNLELQTTTTTFFKLCHHYYKQRGTEKAIVRFTYASSRLISYDHRNVPGGMPCCYILPDKSNR